MKATLYFASRMATWHVFRLLPRPINKQDLDSIKISQSSRLWSIFIFPPTRHPSKVIHVKRKLSSIQKSNSIQLKQGCNYSFIYSTKITRRTYQLHESWQRILPYCCCCLLHEYSTCITWTQSSRTCDLLLSWKIGNSPIIPP